jgi:hypothetical protein
MFAATQFGQRRAATGVFDFTREGKQLWMRGVECRQIDIADGWISACVSAAASLASSLAGMPVNAR